VPESARPPGWLPKPEFDSIYRRVPRLCVEVVIATPEWGVLLTRRDIPPNVGAWHIPGGTVLFAEPVVEAVKRVARDELELEVAVGELLGYIEYPSHYENGLDSPVGLAFSCTIMGGSGERRIPVGGAWFTRLPDGLYAEQREFLARRLGLEG
jgi:ADP-ribose pyrophosphatase YjhB (NUDIX family)